VFILFSSFVKGLPGREAPGFKFFFLQDRNPLARRRKRRHVGAPNEAMWRLHWRLIQWLRSPGLNRGRRYSTGCGHLDSPRRNILRHRGNRFLYLLDIKDAYPNVNLDKLAKILYELAIHLVPEDKIKLFLKLFCFSPNGGLVVGGPASPELFNLYAESLLDHPLGVFCHKHGITFSRYLDDLTFSCSTPIGKRKRLEIRKIILKAGFNINHSKAKVVDLRKGPVVITGIGLNLNGKLFVPGHYRRRIDAVFHKAAKNPKDLKYLAIGMHGLFRSVIPRGELNSRSELRTINRFRSFLSANRNKEALTR